MDNRLKIIYTDIYTADHTVYASSNTGAIRTPCRCSNNYGSLNLFFYVYKHKSSEDMRYLRNRIFEDTFRYIRE